MSDDKVECESMDLRQFLSLPGVHTVKNFHFGFQGDEFYAPTYRLARLSQAREKLVRVQEPAGKKQPEE